MAGNKSAPRGGRRRAVPEPTDRGPRRPLARLIAGLRGRPLVAAVVVVLVLVLGSATVAATQLRDSDAGTDSDSSAVPAAPGGETTGAATASPTAAPVIPAQAIVAGGRLRPLSAAQLQQIAEAKAASQQAKVDARTFSFNVASFNVLGSQHSTPSGDHSRYPPASRRTVGAVDLIKKYAVDVVGTQETQPDQLAGLLSMTGFEAYPGYQFGSNNTDNSILYDPDKFEFVSGTSFPITFENAVRPQTVLLLRNKATNREVYFVNMHTSAGHDAHDNGTRIAGIESGVREVNNLKQSGTPVFVTGDMNDREAFYCRFAPPTGMIAAQGGSISGGCHPAAHLAVDWILTSLGASFSDYVEDRSPMFNVSDHYFVTARATVEPKDDPAVTDDQN